MFYGDNCDELNLNTTVLRFRFPYVPDVCTPSQTNLLITKAVIRSRNHSGFEDHAERVPSSKSRNALQLLVEFASYYCVCTAETRCIITVVCWKHFSFSVALPDVRNPAEISSRDDTRIISVLLRRTMYSYHIQIRHK